MHMCPRAEISIWPTPLLKLEKSAKSLALTCNSKQRDILLFFWFLVPFPKFFPNFTSDFTPSIPSKFKYILKIQTTICNTDNRHQKFQTSTLKPFLEMGLWKNIWLHGKHLYIRFVKLLQYAQLGQWFQVSLPVFLLLELGLPIRSNFAHIETKMSIGIVTA